MLRLLGQVATLLFVAMLAAAAAMAIYSRHVIRSPFFVGLERRATDYACIGEQLDPERPQTRPEHHLARQYLAQDGSQWGPSLSWVIRYWLADRAVRVGTSTVQANRLYASSSFGKFKGFDAVAQAAFGRAYCELSGPQRQQVLDFYWSGRSSLNHLRYPRSA